MKINKTFLKEVLTLQSESGKEKEQINTYIFNILKKLNNKHKLNLLTQEDSIGNIYITKGKADLYPCVVSHTDNVGKYLNNKTIVEINDTLLAFNETGQIDTHGDDKVGMYICFEALINLPTVKVVFYVSEETGMQGANASDLEFLKNTMFILENDRMGNTDWITFSNGVDICNEEFKKFVEPIITSYKYKFERGIATDVGTLVKRNVGVSCANISCGYYKQHHSNSYVKISEVEEALNLTIDVCLEGIKTNKKFEYIYVQPVYNYNKVLGKTYNFKLKQDLYKEVKRRARSEYIKGNPAYYKGMEEACEYVIDLLSDIDGYLVLGDRESKSILVEVMEDYLSLSNKPKCKGECSYLLDDSAIGGPQETCISCGKTKEIQVQYNLYDDIHPWDH